MNALFVGPIQARRAAEAIGARWQPPGVPIVSDSGPVVAWGDHHLFERVAERVTGNPTVWRIAGGSDEFSFASAALRDRCAAIVAPSTAYLEHAETSVVPATVIEPNFDLDTTPNLVPDRTPGMIFSPLPWTLRYPDPRLGHLLSMAEALAHGVYKLCVTCERAELGALDRSGRRNAPTATKCFCGSDLLDPPDVFTHLTISLHDPELDLGKTRALLGFFDLANHVDVIDDIDLEQLPESTPSVTDAFARSALCLELAAADEPSVFEALADQTGQHYLTDRPGTVGSVPRRTAFDLDGRVVSHPELGRSVWRISEALQVATPAEVRAGTTPDAHAIDAAWNEVLSAANYDRVAA